MFRYAILCGALGLLGCGSDDSGSGSNPATGGSSGAAGQGGGSGGVGTGGSSSGGASGASGNGGTSSGGAAGGGGNPNVPPAPLGPYGAKQFTLDAKTYWLNTGLELQAGEKVTLAATGTWTSWAGVIAPHGPTGPTNPQTLDGCPGGGLVAQINLAYAFTGKRFCVGDGMEITAPEDGVLFLQINDYVLEDNDGTLTIDVTSDGAQSPVIDMSEVAYYNLDYVSATWVELQSEHVLLTLKKDLVAKHQATAAQALATFDAFYESHTAIAGATPYTGQRIRYYPDDTIQSFAYMLAGNPIRMVLTSLDNPAPGNSILEVQDKQHSVWAYPHEMGHDFSFINEGRYMIGPGPVEGWANVFNVRTLAKLGYSEGTDEHPVNEAEACAGQAAYLASGTYATFKNDAWLPLCMLLEIRDTYGGWPVLEQFFAAYNALDLSGVPATSASDGNRWKWVRDRMNLASGQNTTPTFQKYKLPVN